MVSDLYFRGIPNAAPKKARGLEHNLDQGVNRVPVLDVEKVDASTENLTFMVSLNAQSLPSVQAAEALF
jgi:hypothetical protein